MKKAAWLAEAIIYFFLSLPLAILPLRISLKAGELLGLFTFYVWGSRRRIAIENIKQSAISENSKDNAPSNPPLKIRGGGGSYDAVSLVKDNFRNLGKSVAEIIKTYYGCGKRIVYSVEIDGAENVEKARSKGRGIIFITGHCGNWELLGSAVSLKVTPVANVARPINNPYINKFIETGRQRCGGGVIYKKGALKDIIRRLRENGSVGILMDQAVIPDEGYVIDFLGRGAWTTKMPALIARKTGAAVIPAFIHRTAKGHLVTLHPEVRLSETQDKEAAVIEDTKRFSEFIEDYIKEHPSEWLWIHRRWKRV